MASGGHSSSQCMGLSTIAASLVAEDRLQTRRLSNCGSLAQPLRGMWDLPGPGLEPVCSVLAGRFLTTAPPGKPHLRFLNRKTGMGEVEELVQSHKASSIQTGFRVGFV